MTALTHFSLFSGIGGIDLASEWAGFTTVGQCEMADYPYKVLCKHWPNVPKWRDVRDVTADSVRAAGIGPVTLISGGFPCQPFSIAGEQLGEDDDRYLWPEMLRVVEELRPTWVLGENVAGIINMALDDVLSSLERIGYSTQPFVIPACSVDADHRRDRVFILAHASGEGLEGVHDARNGVEVQLSQGYFPGNFRKATPRVLRRNHGIPKRWYEAYNGVADEMRELQTVVRQMLALEYREPVQTRLFEEATP